jgi:hypothetical protein
VRLCKGGPDDGQIIRDLTREHFRSEYVYDHSEDALEVWVWRGAETNSLTAREQLLAKIHRQIAETTDTCQRKFCNESFSVVSLHNQIVCLQALAYLVEQQPTIHRIDVPCPKCQGRKSVDGVECRKCNGTGSRTIIEHQTEQAWKSNPYVPSDVP